MPADVMTLVHFSVSACQNLAKSAGEPSFGFALNLARLASTSGDRRNSLIDVLSLSMTWVGVPLGATIAAQKVACRVGNPLSVVVGTAGRESLRTSSAIASAFNFPVWRQEQRNRIKEHLHLPAEQIRDGRRRTFVGNVHDIGAGEELEHFCEKVRLCPKSG